MSLENIDDVELDELLQCVEDYTRTCVMCDKSFWNPFEPSFCEEHV